MELWHLLLTAIFSLLCQEYSRKDGIKRILQSCFFPGFFFQPWRRGRGSGAEGGPPRTGQGGGVVDTVCTGGRF